MADAALRCARAGVTASRRSYLIWASVHRSSTASTASTPTATMSRRIADGRRLAHRSAIAAAFAVSAVIWAGSQTVRSSSEPGDLGDMFFKRRAGVKLALTLPQG